ncbi:MAG: glutathione-disulfide reductase, partial [Synechococcaceae bacterium WB8_1B_136]|nr:glutathione-disulfide reductase [Synechococcaceae bacterium WB8_1B_136]
MQQSFDLIVLGAGSGGLAAAKRAAGYGARVAIVEGDRVGGTCVIRGCVPKKLLVYGSAYRHLLADAPSYGWRVDDVQLDAATLLANVRAEVDRLNTLHIGFLEKAGVELVRGWGRFSGPNSVVVTAADGSERELHGQQILIAVGGRPHRPEIPGAELGWLSDDMFELERFPERVVVVGAGFIACEFAGILNGLGVQVTQLVRGD